MIDVPAPARHTSTTEPAKPPAATVECAEHEALTLIGAHLGALAGRGLAVVRCALGSHRLGQRDRRPVDSKRLGRLRAPRLPRGAVTALPFSCVRYH